MNLVFYRAVEREMNHREESRDSNRANKSVVWSGSLRHTDATLRGRK